MSFRVATVSSKTPRDRRPDPGVSGREDLDSGPELSRRLPFVPGPSWGTSVCARVRRPGRVDGIHPKYCWVSGRSDWTPTHVSMCTKLIVLFTLSFHRQ